MIPEFGHYAIILALCLALLQATLPLIGAWKNNEYFLNLARYTAVGQFVFIGIAFAVLGYAFLTNDFSVAYVAQNSNTSLPWYYRLCAIWGAHEGSLLLWVFVLSIWSAAVAILGRRLPLALLGRVLAVIALISIGFYLFLLTTSDPFVRLLINTPTNGNDLNPLLQDPGLVIHPPMLYMGYVGFSVAFAFAIAALLEGRLDAAWVKWLRPWTLAAWCFLTLGIVLGSWWSYRELGWGGWWFWDPVENASFLPWLAGTALIHSLAVAEKRGTFKAWTILLAVAAFSLSLLGTFLVRSGILISVHAFAVDPKRGIFILRFLSLVVGASLVLYAWRANKVVSVVKINFWSRETMLLLNNVILFVAMLTVLLGTLYPLFIDALGLAKISVGAPYFNLVFVPLMIPLLFLMGVGPLFYWQHRDPRSLIKQLSIIFILVLCLAFLLPWFVGAKMHAAAVLGVSLALWIIVSTVFLQRWHKQQWAMALAHIGMSVVVLGIVLSSVYSTQQQLVIKPGDQVRLQQYQVEFAGITRLHGPNYGGVDAEFIIRKNNSVVAVLHPQERLFNVEKAVLSKVAINATAFRDIYVALGQPLTSGGWEVRLYYKPFVRWIWWGGLLMVFAGLIAVINRSKANGRRSDVCE